MAEENTNNKVVAGIVIVILAVIGVFAYRHYRENKELEDIRAAALRESRARARQGSLVAQGNDVAIAGDVVVIRGGRGGRRGGGAAGDPQLQGDGFVLKVDHTNAPGLKPAAADEESGTGMADGKRVFRNYTIDQFISFMQAAIGAPLVDQTGLTGGFDIEVAPPRMFPLETRTEQVKADMLDQLGISMIPNTNSAAK